MCNDFCILQVQKASLSPLPYLAPLEVQVKAGEMIGIIGPNGAGKSTLLALLSGYYQPSLGTITFLGKPLSVYSLAELAQKRALVTQLNALSFDWPVKAYLQLGTSNLTEEELIEITKALALEPLLSRRMQTLSGGELQRIAIARALCQLQLFQHKDPVRQLLLLDEPNSALDIGHQQRLMRLLHQLCQTRQLSVIVVLHDLNLAANYCDQLWLLNRGHLIAQGPVQSVIQTQLLEQVFEAELHIKSYQQGYAIQIAR